MVGYMMRKRQQRYFGIRGTKMLKIIIILLAFGSVTLLAYKVIPKIMRKYMQAQKKQTDKISAQLDQMFVPSEEKNVRSLSTTLPLGLAVLGFILTRNPVGIAVGVILGLILPRIMVKMMAYRRVTKFQNQLVDGLMLLSSSLRAGMSLNQAFEVLVEEMTPPISEEFAWVVRANQMGVTLQDSLAHLKQRVPVSDLDLINTAIGISRETGGDLTEIFSQLVFTIREKKKLEDRVKSLTVQGRMQGAIMGILPVAFAVFIYFVNPENFTVLLTDQVGRMLLTWAIISEAIGIFMIKKLSKIEV